MIKRELKTNGLQKSFYGKAFVWICSDRSEILQSYNTKVLKRKADGTLVRLWGGYSRTTGRHIRVYCALNKKEYMSLPYEA